MEERPASPEGRLYLQVSVALVSRSGERLTGVVLCRVDDMLAILFPHMFEDIEFLLPPGGEQEPSSSHGVAGLAPRRLHRHVNAEAGPSRLAVP
jgi:hypothetical protein